MSGASRQAPRNRTCPNAKCKPGAILLGFKTPDGRIMHLRTAMAVDTAFVAAAREIGPPERRMRFAAYCADQGCQQWENGRCAVIDDLLDATKEDSTPMAEILPHCPIRDTCQWYAQCGASACMACELFVPEKQELAGGRCKVAAPA